MAEGDERSGSGPHKQQNPGFAEYERNTTREIPVVILDPVSSREAGVTTRTRIFRLVRA